MDVYAQWNPRLQIETGGYSSTGEQAPFFFINGQNGRYENNQHNFLTALSLQSPEKSDSALFKVNYGLELNMGTHDDYNNIWLQKAYIKTRLYMIELLAGRYDQYVGNGDSTLSSGYLLYANNTRHIPRIGLGSAGWTDLPFSRGYIQLKGIIEHGWFERNRYVERVWLHHKNFYVKLGGDLPVNISGGLDHYTQWGGISSNPDLGRFPSDFDTFFEILMAGNADSSDTSLPDNERYNRVGNHLGSWNWRLEADIRPMHVAGYYQSIFEDKSGYRRKLNKDGLWGLSVRFKNINTVRKVVLEYIKTTYQSGSKHVRGEQPGNDNYFNNSLYRNGWSYYRYTIGSPFITSPFYFGDENIKFENTRVIVYYLGITGSTGPVDYEWRTAFSQNKGTHSRNFNPVKNQLSTFIKLTYIFQLKHRLVLNLAFDEGDMYGDNVGLGVSYNYAFTLREH
ncbi:MAG: hypothetical protein GVY19_04070 [Bacteroidetes bacterium]|nr:hypothetical protein [Bacteroidota bacterium]